MPTWIADNAPGEQRVGLVVDNRLVELRLDRSDELPLGFVGQARLASKTANGAFLKTDDGREIFLKGQFSVPDGNAVRFQIIREAMVEPGGMKCAEAAQCADETQATITPRPDTMPDTEGLIEEALELALAGQSFSGPARIAFQRTKAGLVIDIDGDGNAQEINLAAAREVARLLRLFDVAGSVLVDFVSMASKEERQTVADAFDATSAADSRPFERTAINGFGLMQIVRKKERPSVLDHLFGGNIASPSAMTMALWLLRDIWYSQGVGARSVTTSQLIAIILERPKWAELVEQCARHIGAPVEIIVDPAASGYGQVHAKPL